MSSAGETGNWIEEREVQTMFFGKKDRDIRVSDVEYNKLVNGMSKKERREFDRKQEQLCRDREDNRLMAWLEFEDEMDGH